VCACAVVSCRVLKKCVCVCVVSCHAQLRGMVMGGVPTKYRASLWRALCYAHPWAAQQRTNEPALYAVPTHHPLPSSRAQRPRFRSRVR
jgi:hypothetical protein